MRALAAVVLVAGALALQGPSSAASSRGGVPVTRIDLDGAVEPVSASSVIDAIHAAARTKSVVLIRIDTPGGLDSATRKVVGAILASPVPVICWVGPSGARAASSGAFVLQACHWAAMAPGTSVGAAHPVGLRGKVMSDKLTNDASAFMRSIVQQRGRNHEWAEKAVRESAALSATDAVSMRVADAVAPTISDALESADNQHVPVGEIHGQLETWPASVTTVQIPAARRILGALVDPNLAFLLLVLGLAGLAFEILHPGIGLPGISGFVSLALGLVMLQLLPVNVAGLVLLGAGLAFLVLEVHAPGFGLPAAAGVASLAAGGLLLFDARTLVEVSRAVIVMVVVLTTIAFLTVVRSVARVRRLPVPLRTLHGAEGVAATDLDPAGTVRVRSEEWSAESMDGRIEAGTPVLVMEHEGLRLKVVRA